MRQFHEHRVLALLLIVAVTFCTAVAAKDPDWRTYENPRFGYQIEIPSALFGLNPADVTDDSGVKLLELGGDAQLSVFGAYNVEYRSAADFRTEAEQADRIREVTYRAEGRRWFVLSGFYQREDDERQDLIFYAKFMFSRDRSTVSGFEISYPIAEKERFDPIVARLERSLTAPRSQ